MTVGNMIMFPQAFKVSCMTTLQQFCFCFAGFFLSYNASDLAPNITTAVRALKAQYPNAPLYVAGHSMGAAMAHICAMDLKFTLEFEDVNVYTYGSPRIGNTIFKDFFNKIVNVSALQLVPGLCYWCPALMHVHRCTACDCEAAWLCCSQLSITHLQ